MRDVFRSWGYREIDTPVLMDYETLRTAGSSAEDVAYKLVDEGGRILVLRPDMTAPIAEMASQSWSDIPRPIRLCYFSRLFRRGNGEREFFQAGAELIGGGDVAADAEVVALCCEILAAAGLEDFQVNLGHTSVLREISSSLGLDEGESARLRASLARRDIVAVESLLATLSPDVARRAEVLLPYRGVLSMDDLDELGAAGVAENLVARIRRLLQWLEHFAPKTAVGFDPSLVRRLDYYTGSVFEIYCPETGDFLGGGGRYDGLMGRFGGEEPATGFALDMQSVQSAVDLREDEANGDELCLILTEREYPGAAVRLARELRGRGYAVIVESAGEDIVDPERRGEALGATTVYVVGENQREFRMGADEGGGS